MPNPLVPTISGNQISASALLANPTRLNNLVARLAAEQLVFDAFMRPAGGTVTGGGLVYDVLLTGGNFTSVDAEARTPGSQYIVTSAEVTRGLATPEDYGARVRILDEERVRFDPTVLANRITALANTIAAKVDALAIAAVETALTKYGIADVPGHDWSELVTVGDPADITPNGSRPTADLARASLLVRADDLGIGEPDTLVLHPNELANLRIGYGSELPDVLAGVGIANVRTSMRVAVGTAYVVTAGAAGVMGFEPSPAAPTQAGLVTEVIPDREHRATWIQSYCLPAFALTVPGAIRKITGLAG